MTYSQVVSSDMWVTIIAVVLGLVGLFVGGMNYDRDSEKRMQSHIVCAVLAFSAVLGISVFDYTNFGWPIIGIVVALFVTLIGLAALGYVARPVIDAIEDWRMVAAILAVALVVGYFVLQLLHGETITLKL